MVAAAPQQVTTTFLLPALQHFSHLLSPSHRSRSVKAGSANALLEVCETIRLHHNNVALHPPAISTLRELMYLSVLNQLLSLQVVEGLRALLHQAAGADHLDLQERPAGSLVELEASTSGRPGDGATLFAHRFEPPPRFLSASQDSATSLAGSRVADGKKEPLQKAGDLLLERLLAAWAECTPGQLSAAPEVATVQCCEAILDCIGLLLDRMPPGEAPIYPRYFQFFFWQK